MKSVIYEFDPAIYPFPLLVAKQLDEKEMKDRFWVVNEREENVEAQDEFRPGPTTTARVLTLVDKTTEKMYYIIIVFKPKIVRYGIITHESIHLADAYLQYLGFSAPKPYDDEQYAYFGGWIANCVWSVLNNEPRLMNGIKFE